MPINSAAALPPNCIQIDQKEAAPDSEYLTKMKILAKKIMYFITDNNVLHDNSGEITPEIKEELTNLTQKAHNLISVHPVLNSTKAKEILAELHEQLNLLSKDPEKEQKEELLKTGIEKFKKIIEFQEDPFSETNQLPLVDLYNSLNTLIDLGFLKGFPLEDEDTPEN